MKALIQGLLAGTQPPAHAAASREALDRLREHFNGDLPADLRPRASSLRPAAVLLPLVEREEGLTVILTQRTDTLPEHPGQVAFPGGRVEENEGILEAALRETEEEIGLARHHVRPAGFLRPYMTITGYTVVPVVGFIRPGFPELTPDPVEVADIFEVPLAFLMDPANRREESREFRQRVVTYQVIDYRDGDSHYRIWGATAAMLMDFVDTLQRALDEAS